MILSGNNSKQRHIPQGQYTHPTSAGNMHGVSPINTIRAWGKGHFVAEVRQLLEVERKQRGYYPPLPEVFTLIEREFGHDMAQQSHLTNLPSALRRQGCCYHDDGAAEYHSRQPVGAPLMDVNAPYALPWGTVINYLYWKLPRLMPNGDGFELNSFVFELLPDNVFCIAGQGVERYIAGDSRSHAIARVLMALRGDDIARNARPAPIKHASKTIDRLPARPARKFEFKRPNLSAVTGSELPPLPSYGWKESDRRAVAKQFNKRGYAPSEIAEAMGVPVDVIRSDLATKGK